MNKNDLFRAFADVDDDILERSDISAARQRKPAFRIWGALPAAVAAVVIVAAFAAALRAGYIGTVRHPELVEPTAAAQTPRPEEPGPVQDGDTRAEAWFTAEELGMTAPEGTVSGGLAVPIFIAYRGGFYGLVDTDRMDSPRFAPSGWESLLFNTYYTHDVYLVEGHPDQIAIHINGMEVYEKIFEVIFEVDETTYAIAYSPVMNADYGLGNVVLEAEEYTVYEAVKLQGEPARTAEYIVDILPFLQRWWPNFFDGSNLEPGGSYADQWQLALPLE